jgi:hypothetical protein
MYNMKLEGENNATLLDYYSGNDSVCGFASIGSGEGGSKLWADAERRSVLENQPGLRARRSLRLLERVPPNCECGDCAHSEPTPSPLMLGR